MNLAPVTIVGNLTADPELTFTTSGQGRLTFSVAQTHVWYDQAGEKQEKTSYFNITAWRYLAENSARTLEKGIGVIVYGRLEQRSYEDKEGNKRSIVEVVAEEIAISTKSLETIERRQRSEGADGQGGASRGSSPQQQRRTRPSTAKVGSGAPLMDEIEAEEPF
jgi:single-strand DNA-binding protein